MQSITLAPGAISNQSGTSQSAMSHILPPVLHVIIGFILNRPGFLMTHGFLLFQHRMRKDQTVFQTVKAISISTVYIYCLAKGGIKKLQVEFK